MLIHAYLSGYDAVFDETASMYQQTPVLPPGNMTLKSLIQAIN